MSAATTLERPFAPDRAAAGAAPAAPSSPARRLEAGRSDLAACVHCGLCLPACPTYEETRDENDSPRGRVHLMKLAVEGRLNTGGAFAYHIDRCLGCRACEPACPAGVRFGSLLERAHEDRARGGHAAARWLIGALTGTASPLAYAALRLLRRSGLAAAGEQLPGRVGDALAWLAATSPPAGFRRAPRAAPSGFPGAPRPAPPSPSGREPDSITYALLEGCIMNGLFGRIHAATRRVLAACGYVEAGAAGQVCCGALHAHAGLATGARRLAKRNIEAFERSGARWFAVNSAGCGAAIKQYPDWLADSPGWHGRAERLASATCDATRLVAIGSDLSAEFEASVAHDAPCHLSYGMLDDEAPIEALAAVHGLAVRNLPSSRRCCGGAGLYALVHPELSGRILETKLREIEQGGFDVVATGNPGCMMQIGAGLHRRGSSVAVAHPMEILDLGLRRAGPTGGSG